MDFGGSCFVEDMQGILGIHSGAGHDDETAIGLLHQLLDKGDALCCGWSLAGGEEPVAAQGDDVFERLGGALAHIKGTVEGDAQSGSLPYPLPHGFFVDVAFWGEGAYDYTMGTQ